MLRKDGAPKKTQAVRRREMSKARNIFWVPIEARWAHLKASVKQPTIGKLIDDAMEAIERVPENTSLKGVLPKNYAANC